MGIETEFNEINNNYHEKSRRVAGNVILPKVPNFSRYFPLPLNYISYAFGAAKGVNFKANDAE